MKCDSELNARQKKIMTYLLCCRTIKEASQKAGVRLATVFRWLKDPEFKADDKQKIKEVQQRLIKENGLENKDILIIFVFDFALAA